MLLKTSALLLVTILIGCGGAGNKSEPVNTSPPITLTSTAPAAPNLGGTSNEFASADLTLAWAIPTSREDGSALPLGDIAGYEISYENSVNEMTIINLSDALATSYKINNLAPDDYQFVIFAYDTNNAVSAPSPAVSIRQSDFPTL